MGRGVLHPALAATGFRLSRHAPSAALAPFVEFHWIVAWDRPGLPPFEQKILPHPNVHLAFEHPGPAVHGVERGLFIRRIEGTGHVLGVKFLPGGFRPFWGRPVSELTGRTVPAHAVLGPAADGAGRAILATTDESAMVAHAEALLLAARPEPDPLVAEVAGMVARIVADPGLTRVDALAGTLGVSARRLQRLFSGYVGVSPKWVLRRARLHEAHERADHGLDLDWAALAADLGYADQAHLTRDFTATIGVPPSRYAAG
ncbi:helix-turn-helix domain-containing protein [Longispora sp. K20-0274]|uniref:DUF6597 domain-containing transcriptional factor n=1 Tax=Longispora sp. K20-0274 TaxID=3088255 RepID=UPI00399AE375